MTEREIDIADMQCWVFRIAQTRWHISPIECAELFKSTIYSDIFPNVTTCSVHTAIIMLLMTLN